MGTPSTNKTEIQKLSQDIRLATLAFQVAGELGDEKATELVIVEGQKLMERAGEFLSRTEVTPGFEPVY